MRPRTMSKLCAVATSAATAACLLAPAASGAHDGDTRLRTLEPVTAFARQVRGIERFSDLPVLLPDRVTVEVPRTRGVEAKWSAHRGDWTLSLGVGPRCGGANACFVGVFSARRGGRLTLERRVTLAGDVPARFKPTTCGASCSPPQIQWRTRGVLYDVQLRAAGPGNDRAKLVRLADSALAAGPR